ncbi:hypothetical protein T484DRAFT_1816960 [Baffinella frigidus]|nr:hypothetical protein T484DRAFT_1816960 [Cryptophyta sp. CCMP2293]
MSATMDGDVLGNYFNGCPRVSFPGRAFPVKTFHLEDALQLVQHRGDFFPAPSQQDFARRFPKHGAGVCEDFARRFPKHGAGVCEALATLDHEAINIQLIVELVTWKLTRAARVGDAAARLASA